MSDRSDALTDPVITIGTLAEKSGVSVSAIRKYEAEGLLIPHRTASGHRLFSHEDLERVRIIRRMIQDVGLNMEGIRRLQALLPCWELVQCAPEKRAGCEAYKNTSKPCWMIKGGDCSSKGNECRRCPVYRFGTQCTEEIKSLVHGRSGSDDLSAEARDILDIQDTDKENG